jgi:calcium-dependent protein kinase
MVALKDNSTHDVMQEVKILSKLQHPNILRLYDFYDQDDRLLVVLEKLCGGDLFDRVVSTALH